MLTTTYIGLGSNLNFPVKQIRLAVTALSQLPKTKLTAVSSLYRNPPLDITSQPYYVNAVAELNTTLDPYELLSLLQTIEQLQGRRRTEQRWGPRTLDLDILLFDAISLKEPLLTIPHPAMAQRNFVLYPLWEIAPDLTMPDGQSIALLKPCSAAGLTALKAKITL